ncbi:ARL14 effector protein-like [Drosophila suzukii]|uniref:ARL14 effector protein-like n=1 Tax=Drosophila suzukii TaxID=28584 RepID=A0AB40DKF0_DROSZ|nr:ARL14 effector protein-like [Drosophila suzukii]XP_036678523.1 ARL14 effector protein-like [Drosophila suzukii]
MSSYIDPDYSIGRNLRQRQRRIGVYNANEGIDSDKNKRKGKKKGQCFGKNSAYDEYGNIRINGLDICDCLNKECEGCWYECRSCGSTRCGPQCRSNRKFFYEGITYDGKDLSMHNKYIPK